VAAANPGQRVLGGSAGPGAPNALGISRAIARLLGHAWDEVLPGEGAAATLGRHRWDAPHPIVLDTTAAHGRGYTPAGDHAATAVDEADWLVRAAACGPDADIVRGLDPGYFGPMLDYAAKDRYLPGPLP
jgi:hypothetical protein